MAAMISVRSRRHCELIDVTELVKQQVRRSSVRSGLCFIFVPHTTAAITVNENADPTVREDVLSFLEQAVPWSGPYRHLEGNAAAHIRASILGASVAIPVEEGQLQLGVWQGIYLAEFDGPRERRILVEVLPSEHREPNPS